MKKLKKIDNIKESNFASRRWQLSIVDYETVKSLTLRSSRIQFHQNDSLERNEKQISHRTSASKEEPA